MGKRIASLERMKKRSWVAEDLQPGTRQPCCLYHCLFCASQCFIGTLPNMKSCTNIPWILVRKYLNKLLFIWPGRQFKNLSLLNTRPGKQFIQGQKKGKALFHVGMVQRDILPFKDPLRMTCIADRTNPELCFN